jgi:CRP/FNR family transcriptional regulator/CRP/FNR family cyclic AMP-dependent transcriptional regulator
MRTNEELEIAAALQRVPLFASLSPSQLAELARVARRFNYARDETIFFQEDDGDTFYVILSGQVKVSVTSPEGQEAILVMLDAGEGFGEFALLDDQPRSATIEATQPTEVLSLRKDDFRRLLRQMPDIAIALLKVLTKRLRDTDQLVQDAAFLDVGDRLAKKLLSLMETHGRTVPQGIELGLKLTQQDLASMIGATRESVNKQLGAFRDRGIVAVDRQRIIILRPETLRARVDAF